MVEQGNDPVQHKRADTQMRKAKAAVKQTDGQFKAFSITWLDERLAGKSEGYRKQMRSRLERFVWPEIGSMALEDVRPADVLRIIEARRATPTTADLGRFWWAVEKQGAHYATIVATKLLMYSRSAWAQAKAQVREHIGRVLIADHEDFMANRS